MPRPVAFLALIAMIIIFVSGEEIHAAVPVALPFGKTAAGEEVEVFNLSNQAGMTARIMTRGATIVSLRVPDREGKADDVVLGFDSVTGYESSANQYFGCLTGRVANRIAKAKFLLDGKEYSLLVNNGPNCLHGGGPRSLDKVIWQGKGFETVAGMGVTFFYTSVDGEEGFPGNLNLTVSYLLKRDQNELVLTYKAVTDQATPVNLTNHSYFNLDGAGAKTVLNHELQLFADTFTPTDETLIPTGAFESVEGSPLDFRKPQLIGARIQQLEKTPAKGYDHNYVVSGDAGTVRPVARLSSEVSGRVLEIACDVPGVQIYTGNFLNGQTGRAGKAYLHRSAVCLETQHFPDSVNQPAFPTTILKPGAIYEQTCEWRFLTK